MTLEIIESAIEMHIAWVQRFRAALSGSAEDFDLAQASDDTACSLGKWLGNPETRKLLGDDYFKRTLALHGTFHEIAGAIILSLEEKDPEDVTRGLIEALADLSRSLIEFLEFARQQLKGAPRFWAI